MKEIKAFAYVARKYGFKIKGEEKMIVLIAKNTDGEDVKWIKFYPLSERVKYAGNTDFLNLWFYETRKDLNAKRIASFVHELNKALDIKNNPFKISDLIDPEDWQEIEGVENGVDDVRYDKSFF